MCFVMFFIGSKRQRRMLPRRKSCMVFLVLLLTELFFLRLGPNCSMLCFMRRFFFCVNNLVFVTFVKEMLILASSMR